MNAPQLSHIPVEPVESSNIAALGYLPETRTLAIEFKTTRQTWHHFGLSQQAFNDLRNAPSIGSHFARHIKKQYPGLPYPGPAPQPADQVAPA